MKKRLITFAKRYFNIAEKTERVAICGSFYFYEN